MMISPNSIAGFKYHAKRMSFEVGQLPPTSQTGTLFEEKNGTLFEGAYKP